MVIILLQYQRAQSNRPYPHLNRAKMSIKNIEQTVEDYARSARLAKQAGYDGVEIMGSEGYLLNQFLSSHVNQRNDSYGGDIHGRMKFAVDVVKAVREATGEDFIILFRLSVIDLVKDGNVMDEVITVAKALEEAGVTIMNTGIGWHEARVPTIVTSVPRAAFVDFTAEIKKHINIPMMAANRINMPDTAEDIVASGQADMIQMARPFLADAQWVSKAKNGQADRINTCIACNQACLDHTFENKRSTCWSILRACYELNWSIKKPKNLKKLQSLVVASRECQRRMWQHCVVTMSHCLKQKTSWVGNSTMPKSSQAKKSFSKPFATISMSLSI